MTLAAGNAKSHPVSSGGRHETAIAFLTDLEERLDVAQVQLDIYNFLYPHIGDAEEVGKRIKLLDQRLFTISEVCFSNAFADIVDHIFMQAVSRLRNTVRPRRLQTTLYTCLRTSRREYRTADMDTDFRRKCVVVIKLCAPLTEIIREVIQEFEDEKTQADKVMAKVVRLGRRFFPSESAFPLRKCRTRVRVLDAHISV